jgi:DNA-binding MarR family transcriptional regulator
MASISSRIQAEIRQSRPFASRSQEAVIALLRTTDRVRRLIAEQLAPFEVTPQQYNVLRILRGAGPEGLPTLEIADRMIEDAPGITRLIDRLEAKSMVSRERCPTDRRQVTCRIGKPGLKLLAEVDQMVAESDEILGAHLNKQELERLIALLDKIRAGLAEKP